MQIFYEPNISTTPILNEEEAAHCTRVLRKKEGDSILIIDGKGSRFEAEIESVHKKMVSLKNVKLELKAAAPLHTIHIAVAPTKNNDRLEWFLEKATEIGVDQVTPVICKNSERRKTNEERFEKIIVAATKQCKRLWKPTLNETITIEQFIKSCNAKQKFIAWCETAETEHLFKLIAPQTDTVVLIGPEGDFTQQEVEMAIKAGFKPVSLGENRLRTETAALYACQIAKLVME